MKIYAFLAIALGVVACRGEQKTEVANTLVEARAYTCEEANMFNQDSAYSFVKKQCDFGARVPNSAPHEACASYLSSELKRLGAEVTEQKTTVTAYDGTRLNANNIIGTFFPEKENRVIFFSHWDSRPYCDHDPNEANHRKPVMGANDGASGVGVLLELARVMQQKEPKMGVDIVFLDAEDYGAPYFFKKEVENDWCLGSQFWSKHTHYKVKPKYGVLLDMVGGNDPTFFIDKVTARYAYSAASRVWSRAQEMGYGKYFIPREEGMIMDDHYYVNIWAGIPTADIIDFNADRGFPTTWHTMNDTPENINSSSLGMVGRILTSLIY